MPVNDKFDAANHYFSGQGVVMIGLRDAVTGNPLGLRPVGNVPDLKITIATTVVDHKGSQDGQRAVDKRLQTETKATASITIENWISKNLAKALRGDETPIVAGSVTGEAFVSFPGLVSGLKYISVSSVVIKQGGTSLTAYTNPTTAYDYRTNLDAGSIELNDGSSVGFGGLGTAPTGVTVGATTLITVANTAAVGDSVYFYGFTGADAADLNGKTLTVTVATPTAITVAVVSTAHTITFSTAKVVFLGQTVALTADYSYAAQFLVDSLTEPLTDSWLRFEGLNTVEENSPVVVDIFRFSNDPLKELALISDTFGQFVLEGVVLKDDTRPSGSSSYFQVKKLN